MELTLEAVAKDAFRRDFFLRCFSEREAQALELRFSFLHRVRQYKRLVGRRDLLPRAAKDIATSYLQDVESTDQLLLPPSSEPLRIRVLNAVASGYFPLDLFCGMETTVRDHMTRDAFPHFLRSPEYLELCDALRARRDLPLAEVLVDSRRTQFLMRFLSEEFPGEEGNLRFWVHVQTRFLPLIQTSLFSVALFEEVQRHVRHVFNKFLVSSSEEKQGDDASSAATQVPEDVRRATLQQIMRLQSEPFSPPRYANLFRAAQDYVWEWLLSKVYPKFRMSTLYVMLVVETEDLEADKQLRRLSEHVQATVKRSTTTGKQERQSETLPKLAARKNETQLKANAVLVPVNQTQPQNMWGVGDGDHHAFDRVLVVQELAEHGVHSISVVSMRPPIALVVGANQVIYEQFCTGNEQEAAAETHSTQLNYWRKNDITSANPPSPTKRALQNSAPKPTLHDFILPKESHEAHNLHQEENKRYLFGVCLTMWRLLPNRKEPNATLTDAAPTLCSTGRKDASNAQYWPQFVSVLTTRPMYKTSRQLLLQLATGGIDNLTEASIADSIAAVFASSPPTRQLTLNAKYEGFYLSESLRPADLPVSSIFKELSSQTFVSLLASIFVGKSIILVSERSSAAFLVGEALRELLKPFQWAHFYLPFCPVTMSWDLRDAGLFSEENASPFLIGCEGVLSHQKKDSGSDQRYRIRNNLYNIHKVSLQLQAPVVIGSSDYPPELLQTQAIIIDIDADDVYTPEKVEIPELPQSLLRSLESMLSSALQTSRITHSDSHLFSPSKTSSFVTEMLKEPEETCQLESSTQLASSKLQWPPNPSLAEGARLTLLWFLEALFGDVVYYFCSFHENFAVEAQSTLADADEFLMFEVDSFLDAHTELGCRDFFRQCFHTKLFRNFLLSQHAQYSSPTPSGNLEILSSKGEEPPQLELPVDAYI